MADGIDPRDAVHEYYAAQDRAKSAPIGSGAFQRAMSDVQRLCRELARVGVDPLTSWREGTRRKLRAPVPPRRPGQRERSKARSAERASR